MAKLTDVEGIGPANAKKLKAAGIGSTDTLLKLCCDRKGRAAAAKQTGISEDKLLTWVNHVDLFRIKGIGEEYADLLERAGVDSVPELGKRKADNLHAAILETNRKKKLVRQPPAASQVAAWIDQAKKLPKVVRH